MALSASADKLRKLIDQAIEDHKISRTEMEAIIFQVTEDGHVDPQEQALLNQLQEMIENKELKIIP